MNNPAFALAWETWRLARRWYLWVLPVALALDFLIMRQASVIAARGSRGMGTPVEIVTVLIAPSALAINFALAIFATLLAISLGNKSGFPLAFGYRLPVKTSLLVAVPMATLAALCASLYLLPMLLVRMTYDVPLPLLPGAALIAVLVVVLLACGWSTTGSGPRTFAMLVGIVVASQLFALLDPIDMQGQGFVPGQAPVFNRDIIALSTGEYAALAVVGLMLYALVVAAISKQRYGEAPLLQLPGVAPAKPRKPATGLVPALMRASGLLIPTCPTGAPWLAELWLEARRQMLPILLLGALVAACVPMLYAMGVTPGEPFEGADYVFPGAVFFVGIGIAIFNRRQASGGFMSAFEGTRGMSTLGLAAIQMLSVVTATLCGIALVLISVHVASQLFDAPGKLALRIEQALALAREASPLYLLAAAISGFVNYVAWVMLLACIHTWSVVWGRWVPYGAGIITIYGAAQVIRIQAGRATLEDIAQHLWLIAITIFVMTVLAFARTLYTRVLTLRVSGALLVAWVLFLASSFHGMARQGIVFARLAPEMQAFQAALLTAPLLLFILLLWSYDRLRHR